VLYSFSFIADGENRSQEVKVKKFAMWWRRALPDAKRQVAKDAKTSYSHLSNVVHGTRDIGPELAGRIETALSGELTRGDLCATCRACVYFKGEK